MRCWTSFSTVIQLYRGCQCTYPCFPRILLTSTRHNILSKPLAAFTHNHCLNNGQWWERNESCCNDYHQSSESILAELGIEPPVLKSATLLTELRGSAGTGLKDSVALVTLSQTTNFRLFQTERICRRHFQIWQKWQIVIQTGTKNTVEKGEIARYDHFYLFPQCFQKACTADT